MVVLVCVHCSHFNKLLLGYTTYICDKKLFAIIKSRNLGFTLRNKVVLFDVFVKQELFYICQLSQNVFVRLSLVIFDCALCNTWKQDISIIGLQSKQQNHLSLYVGDRARSSIIIVRQASN